MLSLLEQELVFPVKSDQDELLMERNEYAGKINALDVALRLVDNDNFSKELTKYGESRLSGSTPSAFEQAIYETCEELAILCS